MSSVLTRADSIRRYLTGAASDGAAQTDVNLSLGNFRSSTEATDFGITTFNLIANITVDYASGGNNAGAGTLECVDANTLKWKDFGGSFGASVTIANGETKVLEAAGNPGSFIRITRTSATALVAGTTTVTLAAQLNNLLCFDDVASSEASAGDTEYRGMILKNVSAGTVTLLKLWLGVLGTQRTSAGGQLGASGAGTITISSGTFDDWPENGFCHVRTSGGTTREIVYYSSRTSTVLTVPANGRALLGTSAGAGSASDLVDAVPGIAIATDTAGVTAPGSIQTVANEGTAPTSVTWVTGLTSSTGLNIGTMTTGQQVGIWFKRQIPIGAVSSVNLATLIEGSFDAP